jgi:hypothetical protein
MSRHTITVICDHGGGGLGVAVGIVAGAVLLGSGAAAAVVSAVVLALEITAAVFAALAAVAAVVIVRRRRGRRGWQPRRSALVAPYWRPPVSGPDEAPRQLPAGRTIPGRVLPPASPVCQNRPRDRHGRRG